MRQLNWGYTEFVDHCVKLMGCTAETVDEVAHIDNLVTDACDQYIDVLYISQTRIAGLK